MQVTRFYIPLQIYVFCKSVYPVKVNGYSIPTQVKRYCIKHKSIGPQTQFLKVGQVGDSVGTPPVAAAQERADPRRAAASSHTDRSQFACVRLLTRLSRSLSSFLLTERLPDPGSFCDGAAVVMVIGARNVTTLLPLRQPSVQRRIQPQIQGQIQADPGPHLIQFQIHGKFQWKVQGKVQCGSKGTTWHIQRKIQEQMLVIGVTKWPDTPGEEAWVSGHLSWG